MEETREDRIAALYEEHRQGLYTHALALTGCRAAAEDAVHAAMSKLLKKAILPEHLKSYAYRCVRNVAVDEWRRHEARKDNLFDLESLAVAPAGVTECMAIDEALGRLPGPQREVIVLKAMNGLTFREIARIRKESINTVSSRYRRGLGQMRALLQEKPS